MSGSSSFGSVAGSWCTTSRLACAPDRNAQPTLKGDSMNGNYHVWTVVGILITLAIVVWLVSVLT